ncbi:MAG: 23S rRNA (adenine(2030)-N(6))-methyltransferase RlmJ [Hydrogenophilales bacterium CG03_land_8_20_14_0_80_62_28]|nr:23S rRNA (adenine(2030)-N(6))-methyltransferase RlmJ [Betaproteobacteria bacterium]OIO78941.1 MAG: 23S rRNA (adenine(2030)-N(6))-methyltransferase RlmJ [Hydrogenophilaceae bacterium CG1_02_62_390]PIV23060.1 MAG: 23S rRNA (adenine(2030)-N(6))-methyltransferase RlmJ [Hydrogenophilales bacterium CG03_land_8_20_14_0_80_62_28]PIW38957.1 MAG: 23S rRNA (adenine(2030)-N(6))-methyltransferase RlmJ [Hydrogenophilales bacterium CG15_BIG_FIL_POST_REV_8_21_14_020_62_31]PIW70994.1 MAG: 23S rRNA (adenine(2
MLSYRHAFHAGNHADVLKHCLLVAILRHMNKKAKPWWYVDSHAGAGIYDLHSEYARKLDEFQTGIGRLWQRNDLPELLADYLDQVRKLNADGALRLYPGSPWLARQLMRRDDQLRLFELHSTDAEMLRHTFSEYSHHIKVEAVDGFDGLTAVLPPQPRRGLVLIDPSYELKEDYRQVPRAIKDALDRFATGTYVIWYPQLQRDEARQFPERLKRLPVKAWLDVSLTIRGPSADGLGMHGSGLFIINPPWQLAAQLTTVMPYLVDLLGQDANAGYRLEQRENG